MHNLKQITDNIKCSILIGIISIIGLVGTIIYLKKEFN